MLIQNLIPFPFSTQVPTIRRSALSAQLSDHLQIILHTQRATGPAHHALQDPRAKDRQGCSEALYQALRDACQVPVGI